MTNLIARLLDATKHNGLKLRYHARLWGRVDMSDPAACWNWSRAANPKLYGSFGLFGKTAPAHRVAYALYHNADPGELFVCHRCDNRRCINPAHLFLGTQGDNIRDMVAKGRHHMQRNRAA
jgi:hypothetical protein